MFNRIDRYIAKQLIGASLFVLFLLICLRSLFGLIQELKSVGQASYQVSDALLFTGLMLPERLLEFFPMGVLIGALFALGNMASHAELTVMRAAGMTTWRIAGSTIKASMLLMILVVAIGEWVVPYSSKSAQRLWAATSSSGELSYSQGGIWAKKDNTFIHIKNVLSSTRLSKVVIYSFDEKNRIDSIIEAEMAEKASQDDEQNWYLHKVKQTRFFAEKLSVEQLDKQIWQNPLMPSQIDTLTFEPETLNFSGLREYLAYAEQSGMETATLKLALWQKMFQPLSIGIMVFLAVSFVFGPMRDSSVGARILSGVMLGFGFHLINQSFGPVTLVFNVWPFIGAVTPILIFTFLAYWLMMKSR